MEFYEYIIAILGGFFAGAINTFAGNGSAITLTILTEMLQLPGNLANGTNRVGVFFQTTFGAFAFHKNGKLDIQRGWRYMIPTIVGAIIGVLVAVWVTSAQFIQVFRVLLVLMLLVILVKPKRWINPVERKKPLAGFITIPLFLALGFYGGFIQMGMGIFFLAAMVLIARYDLVHGNAIKLFVVGVYTTVVLGIFQWRGLIDWHIGLVMAIGQTSGGWLTASFASKFPGANTVAYYVLVLVVLMAIGFLFDVHLLFQ